MVTRSQPLCDTTTQFTTMQVPQNSVEAGPELVQNSGKFVRPPTATDIERILKSIRETGRPETVVDLSWNKPSRDLEFQLFLPKIEVDRKLRPDGDLINCPFCSPEHPKCLSFYLLWSSDGHLRVIGHICGRRFLGAGNFAALHADAKQALDRYANENYALTILPGFNQIIRDAEELLKASCSLQEVKRRFAKRMPTLQKVIMSMAKTHDGLLVVERRASADSNQGARTSLGGKQKFDIVPLGRLTGLGFLKRTWSPEPKARSIVTDLLGCVGGRRHQLSEDDILDFVLGATDAELANFRKQAQDAIGRAIELAQQIDETASFLSETNLKLLQGWGRHELNSFKVSVQLTSNEARIWVSQKCSCVVPLGSELRTPAFVALR